MSLSVLYSTRQQFGPRYSKPVQFLFTQGNSGRPLLHHLSKCCPAMMVNAMAFDISTTFAVSRRHKSDILSSFELLCQQRKTAICPSLNSSCSSRSIVTTANSIGLFLKHVNFPGRLFLAIWSRYMSQIHESLVSLCPPMVFFAVPTKLEQNHRLVSIQIAIEKDVDSITLCINSDLRSACQFYRCVLLFQGGSKCTSQFLFILTPMFLVLETNLEQVAQRGDAPRIDLRYILFKIFNFCKIIGHSGVASSFQTMKKIKEGQAKVMTKNRGVRSADLVPCGSRICLLTDRGAHFGSLFSFVKAEPAL